MPATLTTVSAILKEVYEEDVREQMDNGAVALKRIEKSSEGVTSEVGGKYVAFPIKTRRNQGIGARNELEALPVAGQQGFTGARIGLKYLYGLVRLSGQTIELADTNFQAFTSALDAEMDGLKTDLLIDQNRQVYGDGSGAIGVVVSDGANSAVVKDVMYFQQDMQIDIIDGTTLGNASPTVKASNRKITPINVATNTVTYDGADILAAAGDIFVRTGNVNREWTGFSKIATATGVLYNIDPTVEPIWKATVDSNSGVNRALSEGLMINMVDSIRSQGGTVTAIFQNLGVRRAYFNLLSQQRKFVNTKEFAGGFTGLAFTTDQGEVPVIVDIMAPKNKQFYINEKEITLYREKDWSFMDRDGSKWQRVVGFDAYEATMYQYSELGCHRRNSQGQIQDITEG
jgi:hypothetical protein